MLMFDSVPRLDLTLLWILKVGKILVWLLELVGGVAGWGKEGFCNYRDIYFVLPILK